MYFQFNPIYYTSNELIFMKQRGPNTFSMPIVQKKRIASKHMHIKSLIYHFNQDKKTIIYITNKPFLFSLARKIEYDFMPYSLHQLLKDKNYKHDQLLGKLHFAAKEYTSHKSYAIRIKTPTY